MWTRDWSQVYLCVLQAPEQLVTKPEKEKESRGMADSPQPPWKYWLRVGSAAVGVGVGLMMFPVW